MKRRPLLVTVDGPAASGKSALARKLALRLHVPYLYTGGMYRALAWIALERGLNLQNASNLEGIARRLRMRFMLGGKGDLRMLVGGRDVTRELQLPAVSLAASTYVAQNASVRRLLVARQRRFMSSKGLVAEGRDCGSVVFPHAPFKFFLTASLKVRARRRLADLRRAGVKQSLRVVEAQMRRRDRQDKRDEFGTLQVQPDAWIVDNSRPGMDGILRQMLRRVKGRAL